MTIDFQGPNKTVQEFIDFFKEEYGVTCTMILGTEKTLYSIYQSSHSERLNQTIESIYLKIEENVELYEGKRYIILSVGGQIEETGDEAIVPALRYIL